MTGFARLRTQYDIVVLGGGHAGLQAGLKAALLHHSALVVDRGPRYSRSYYAPRMDNIPGFPQGISGHKLLDLQREALRPYASRVTYLGPAVAQEVVPRPGGGFQVRLEWLRQNQTVAASVVILAMGVVDRMPHVHGKIDHIFPWANFGIVDYCLICDGHTLPGRSVAVLGETRFAVLTALDILHFEPRSVTLLTHGAPLLPDVPPEERMALEAELAAAKIPVMTGEIDAFQGLREKRFGVRFSDGTQVEFDKGFSALGWYRMNSEIPRALGARFDADGFVVTDEDCRVLSAEGEPVIPGLYAVGDLRNGWNQVPEAWATAERAVIHAWAEYLPELREKPRENPPTPVP